MAVSGRAGEAVVVSRMVESLGLWNVVMAAAGTSGKVNVAVGAGRIGAGRADWRFCSTVEDHTDWRISCQVW